MSSEKLSVLQKAKALDEYRTAKKETQDRNLSENETAEHLKPYVNRWQRCCRPEAGSNAPADVVSHASGAPDSDPTSPMLLLADGSQKQTSTGTVPRLLKKFGRRWLKGNNAEKSDLV